MQGLFICPASFLISCDEGLAVHVYPESSDENRALNEKNRSYVKVAVMRWLLDHRRCDIVKQRC